ncbi:MAG: DEAD/DEAH box helicase [Candidatus Micrarchaeota archaeon]
MTENRFVFASGTNSISDQFRFQISDDYNLLFRLSLPENGIWRLEYFMQSKHDPSLIYPIKDAQKSKNIALKLCSARKIAEASKIPGFSTDAIMSGALDLSSAMVYDFLKNDAFALREKGFTVQIPKNLEINVTAPIRINLALRNNNNLITEKASNLDILAFDYSVSLDGIDIDQDEFEAIVRSKTNLVQVRDRWVEINPDDASKVMDLLNKTKEVKSIQKAIGFGISAANEGVEISFSNNGTKFESIIEAISENECFSELNEPEGFIGKLRPYQKRGVGWLDFLSRFGLGALLADDMGLGKTVQVIAHIVKLVKSNRKPILIICPTSVIGNWMDEFSRFAPGLRIFMHHSMERKDGKEFTREVNRMDVILTSYSLVWRDEKEFESIPWAVIVLDEAQNIKNPFTKQTQHIKKLHSEIRIALTGTPIENRLSELWSIMEFLNPGYLPAWKEFKENYAKPIETNSNEKRKLALNRAISPFLLRRLKTDKRIITDLPEKNEIMEWCRLTMEQATLYKAVVDSSMERIEAEIGGKRRIEIFATITKLKQICNHPTNLLKDSLTLGDRSGKVERLHELIQTIIENNESCLIFSQYTEMASLLYENLKKEFGGLAAFYYFHGGLGRKARDKIVKEFQTEAIEVHDIKSDKKPKIMILSLKAGGLGLNLTAATNVIHFDRWWNPAVENQATDRAYRIGQMKNVFVYKLITKGTVEERIADLLVRKKELADSIIGSGEDILTKLDGKQLREIFELRDEATT